MRWATAMVALGLILLGMVMASRQTQAAVHPAMSALKRISAVIAPPATGN
jgi:hypothetical protein